jgi:hypothetical protein
MLLSRLSINYKPMKARIIQEVMSWRKNRELQRLIEKAQKEDLKESKVEKDLNPRRMYIHPEERGLQTYTNPFRASREYSPV